MELKSSAGPKGLGSDVRGELLKAASAIYEERGFDGVALRDIAERAGVNQAMVRYYFDNKHGLEAAMLDDGFERLLDAIPKDSDFKITIQSAISTLNTMPWLPLLAMRTVYASDALRRHFIEKHAPRIVRALGNGLKLRSDLEPKFVFLSIISMVVFPQVARPVVTPVLGLRFDDQFAADFAAYLASLFQERKCP
jgi:TetR/AcrR family transcriptional regulator